jgi:hypothetical protein
MIVVKLMGVLGNQMFQYALGRRLAYDRGVPLRLDLTWFDESPIKGGDTVREFVLDGWRVKAERATEDDLARFPLSRPILKRLSRYFSPLLRPVVTERSFRFDPRVLRVPRTAYLSGYWQSAKYFASIEGLLRTDFSMNVPSCPHVERLVEEAGRAGSISIHVRRGDYVNNPSTNTFHGVCTVDYYRLAAKRVADEVAEPHFLVFSDDPDWARENLKLEWPTSFVEHDSRCVPHNDIWLMSLCSHHIIANSSFSWWGAWLSASPGKVVVAPKQWFRQPGIDTFDLIPAGWLRI